MSPVLLVLPSAVGVHVVNQLEAAKQALVTLAALGCIYRKGGVLVRWIDGRLIVITPSMLTTLLFAVANVMVWKFSRSEKRAVLSAAAEIKESTIKVIMGSHLTDDHILPINVVARNTYLVLDKGVLVALKMGYNPERGGVMVLDGTEPPTVPLDEAIISIRALFDDYNFATPSDRSRAIGAVFCAALRMAGIYERHPLLAFEADDSQAGKTLLWAMIVAIFGQHYGTVAQKRGGVGSLDESIMEKLVTGCGFILFDNLRGKLDSPYLEACLTPETGGMEARVAGVRAIKVDPQLVVFGLTSNGVEMTVDLANRTMMVRIRKQPADYDFKKWANGAGEEVGIREHIESRQAFYQGCVNAILLDWWQAGAQRLPCVDHSFKQTIGALDFIVQHYFKLPPILDGHRVALERTTKPGLTWVRQIALKAAANWFVLDWTASRLAERCISEGLPIPGADGTPDSEAAAKLVGVAMAQAFGSSNRLSVDDVVIERNRVTDTEGRERKVYTFKKEAP